MSARGFALACLSFPSRREKSAMPILTAGALFHIVGRFRGAFKRAHVPFNYRLTCEPIARADERVIGDASLLGRAFR